MTSEANFENGTLTITRTFDASPEDVFDAWVETSKVQQWWGCAQTIEVQSEIEKKVGGKYCHRMTIDTVGEFPLNCRITVYDPPRQLAYVEVSDNPQPMRVTVDFLARGNQTEVRLKQENIPTNLGDVVQGGWTAGFGKLHDLLSDQVSSSTS